MNQPIYRFKFDRFESNGDSHQFCTEFWVTAESTPWLKRDKSQKNKDALNIFLPGSKKQGSMSNQIKLKFGEYNKRTYRPGLPYYGKVG